MSNQKNFTEGKILGPLLKFAIPVLLALFLQSLYGAVDSNLDTILQESGNLHLYEKMGYHRIEKINDRMDIVFYEKD